MTEPIISELQEWVEKRTAFQFYMFTACTICFGYGLDGAAIYFDLSAWQAGWAPRFGAVAAVLVAFAYFNDLRTNESWWRWLRGGYVDEVYDAKAPIRDAESIKKMMVARGAAGEEEHELFSTVRTETRPVLKMLRDQYWGDWSRARKAVKAQGLCVLLGSLVWAFGDLPVALASCGSLRCP